MKLKLDENLGQSVIEQLRQDDYDVTSVAEQDMKGSPDDMLIEVCRLEQRCILTLDMGFANPLLYNPDKYAGIAVLRLPKRQTLNDLHSAVETLIKGLRENPIEGQLWIIRKGSIRQYKPNL